jgi:hypothetical protein
MSFKKIVVAVLAFGTIGLAGVPAAEAKNCQRLCRKEIAHYRQRVCTKYKGVVRVACRREVGKDIMSWCRDEERTDICASIFE